MTFARRLYRNSDTTGQKWSPASRALGWIGAAVMLAFAGTTGCAERVGDCVEVRQNTGATRLPGYTPIACDQHCKQTTGLINCYWDDPFGPTGLNPSPRGAELAGSGAGDDLRDKPKHLAGLGVAVEL